MSIFLMVKRGTFDSFLNIVSLVLIFVVILFLAYITAKIAAKYQGNINSKSNMKIIESIRVGGNKYLSIVKIGDDYYAIGVGKDEINLIDKLDSNNVYTSFYDKNVDQGIEFKELFSNIRRQHDKKKVETYNDKTDLDKQK